jgi:DNA-binding CsgD family transcriptional regulator
MMTSFDTSKELILQPFMSGVRLAMPEEVQNAKHQIRVGDAYDMPCGVYLMNARSEMQDLNEISAQYGGFDSPAAAFGYSVFDLPIPYHDAVKVITEDTEVMRSRKMVINSLSVAATDGKQVDFLSFKLPVYDAAANIIGIFGYSVVTQTQPLVTVLTHLYESGLFSKSTPQSQFMHIQQLMQATNDKVYFTRREQEILLHVLRGATAKQIGLRLGISSRTVENTVERIKQKSDCKNKYDLIAKYIHLISS